MKKFVVCSVFILICYQGFGQKYGLAGGTRIGDQRYGVSLRHRIVKSISAEALFEIAPSLVQASLYPKYHLPLLGEGFNLYVGLGAQLGQQKEAGEVYGFGIMTGLEWKLPAVPLTLSADIKPSYYVQGKEWFEFPAAISVHYVFSKATKKERKKAREKRRKRKARKAKREDRKAHRKEWWEGLKSGERKD